MKVNYWRPGRVREYRSIATVIAYGLPVVAVVGTIVPLILGYPSLAIVSIYATVPAIVVSIAYFSTDELATPSRHVGSRLQSYQVFRLSIAAFVLLQGISLLLLARTDVRPTSYYAVIALSVLLIGGQILFLDLNRPRVGLVLVEMSILLANLIWSVTFNYYYFFGRTDVFGHVNSIRTLLSNHHVTAAFGEYEAFPLWHILVATESMLFDGFGGAVFLSFLTSGIAFMFLIPTVYLFARRLTLSREVSLLAALFTAIHPVVIFQGMYAIPRSIASVLFAVLLLVLAQKGWWSSIAFLGIALAITVYHTATIPFVLVTLFVYFVFERYLKSKESSADYLVSAVDLLVLAAVQLGYWMLAAPDILARVAIVLETTVLGGAAGDGGEQAIASGEIISMPFHELANYIPFGLLLILVLYGVVRGPQTVDMSFRGKVVLPTALALTAVSFPGPLLLVGDQLNILRFAQYTFPFIAIGAGVGLVAAVRTRFRYGTHELKVALVTVLLLSTGFLAVSNDFVASDNPIVEREFYTYYLTESEVESFDSVSDASPDGVMVDYIPCRYFSASPVGECNILQADPESGEVYSGDENTILVRDGELEDRPVQVYATSEYVDDPAYYDSLTYVTRESPVWDDLSTNHRVYDSGSTSAYAPR